MRTNNYLKLLMFLSIFFIVNMHVEVVLGQSVLDTVDSVLKDSTPTSDATDESKGLHSDGSSEYKSGIKTQEKQEDTEEDIEWEDDQNTDINKDNDVSIKNAQQDQNKEESQDEDDDEEIYKKVESLDPLKPIDEKESDEDLKHTLKNIDFEEDDNRPKILAPFMSEGLTAIKPQKSSLYLGLYHNFYTVYSGKKWDWGLTTMFPPGTLPFVLGTIYGATPEQVYNKKYSDYIKPAFYIMTLPWPYFKRSFINNERNHLSFAFDFALMGGYRLLYSYTGDNTHLHFSFGTTNVGPIPIAAHLGMSFVSLLFEKYHLMGAFFIDHRLDVNPAEYLKTLLGGYIGIRVKDNDMYADFGLGGIIFLNGSESNRIPNVDFHPLLVLAIGWL